MKKRMLYIVPGMLLGMALLFGAAETAAANDAGGGGTPVGELKVDSGTSAETTEVVDSGECGENLSWTLDSDGVLEITGTGEMWDYTPTYGNGIYRTSAPWGEADVKELRLTEGLSSIGHGAFSGCSGFTGSLTLPESLTSIGSFAFAYCSGFTGSLTLPEGLTSISDDAFMDCSGFTGSLTLPEGLSSIGYGAFANCSGFTGSLTLPEGLTSIDYYAFMDCSGFTGSLTLPEGLTSIGSFAFADCSGFTGSLTLPSSLTSINNGAFADCSGFTRLELSEGWKSIPVPNAETAFGSLPPEIAEIVIPKSVASIGEEDLTFLQNLTIYCYADSAAHSFAKEHGLKYELLDAPQITLTGLTAVKTRTSYTAGDVLDTGDLTVTAVYSDGSTKKVTAYTTDAASIDMATAGTKTLTVTYEESDVTVTAAVTIQVMEKQTETPSAEDTETTEIEAAGVKLSRSSATVGKGSTLTLAATVSPASATDKSLTWSSSNEKVATVDKNGKVTGIRKGTSTITVTTANGKTAKCKVTVSEVTLNVKTLPLQVKKSTTALEATVSAKGDSVKSWKSSDTKVATVTSKGKITAKKTGTAKITVTTKSGAKATCTVKVQKGKVTTKSLSISEKKLTLQTKKSTTLTLERNPISATEKITWSSSNTKVATVNSKGKVTAKKAGKATITARTSNGKKVTCRVTVKSPKVTLKKTKASIGVGKTTAIQIKSTYPSKDTVKSYKSSNTKVAAVSKSGRVKGLKKGTATITVTMKSGAKAAFQVTVK